MGWAATICRGGCGGHHATGGHVAIGRIRSPHPRGGRRAEGHPRFRTRRPVLNEALGSIASSHVVPCVQAHEVSPPSGADGPQRGLCLSSWLYTCGPPLSVSDNLYNTLVTIDRYLNILP